MVSTKRTKRGHKKERKKKMHYFELDTETNSITVYEDGPNLLNGMPHFASEASLAKLDLPIGKLVEIWNGFAGIPPMQDLKPVKKFENRQKAVRRIWAACQILAAAAPAPVKAKAAEPKTDAPKAARAPKKAKAAAAAASAPATSEGGNKREQAIAMMSRPDGAAITELMEAFGWQKHTVRGFVATLGSKHGLNIESTKVDGVRTYRIA